MTTITSSRTGNPAIVTGDGSYGIKYACNEGSTKPSVHEHYIEPVAGIFVYAT